MSAGRRSFIIIRRLLIFVAVIVYFYMSIAGISAA
jgi:hypothetical protein